MKDLPCAECAKIAQLSLTYYANWEVTDMTGKTLASGNYGLNAAAQLCHDCAIKVLGPQPFILESQAKDCVSDQLSSSNLPKA